MSHMPIAEAVEKATKRSPSESAQGSPKSKKVWTRWLASAELRWGYSLLVCPRCEHRPGAGISSETPRGVLTWACAQERPIWRQKNGERRGSEFGKRQKEATKEVREERRQEDLFSNAVLFSSLPGAHQKKRDSIWLGK